MPTKRENEIKRDNLIQETNDMLKEVLLRLKVLEESVKKINNGKKGK